MKTLTIPTKPIFIKNKNFETILIHVLFPYEEKVDDLAKQTILPSLLAFMNEKYQTESEFQKKRLENYILNFHVKQQTIGTSAAIMFSMTIPDKKNLKEDYLEEQIDFLAQCIYHPKIIDGGFDSFEFDREKENLTKNIKSIDKNFKRYLRKRSNQLVDNENILTQSITNHIEQIETLTRKNVYEFYLDKIKNNTPIIFAMGNIESQEIVPLLEKHLVKTKEKEQTLTANYNYYLKPFRESPQEITEEKDFKDSALVLAYKVKGMKEQDKVTLTAICSLLSSLSSRLLNKKLRDEYNLVYATDTLYYSSFGVLFIYAYINPKNKDLCLEKIKEVIEELKDEEQIAPLLEKIKERFRTNQIKNLDNKNMIINDIIKKKLKIGMTEKEYLKKLEKLTTNDIKELIERLNLDTIYFLKEKSDE